MLQFYCKPTFIMCKNARFAIAGCKIFNSFKNVLYLYQMVYVDSVSKIFNSKWSDLSQKLVGLQNFSHQHYDLKSVIQHSIHGPVGTCLSTNSENVYEPVGTYFSMNWYSEHVNEPVGSRLLVNWQILNKFMSVSSYLSENWHIVYEPVGSWTDRQLTCFWTIIKIPPGPCFGVCYFLCWFSSQVFIKEAL